MSKVEEDFFIFFISLRFVFLAVSFWISCCFHFSSFVMLERNFCEEFFALQQQFCKYSVNLNQVFSPKFFIKMSKLFLYQIFPNLASSIKIVH